VRNIATFRSTTFNATDPKPYFINPCCFGDDLAQWLISQLRARSVETENEPGQEDFGWYLGLRLAGTRYFLIITFRPDDVVEGKTWIIRIERNCGLIARAFGGQKRGIDVAVPQLLRSILTDAAHIEDVRWHSSEEFEKESEEFYGLKP
jgi:hypothetical protein